MATLRAIGYGALPVAASVIFEALLLALIGALAGAVVAWLLFDGREIMIDENVYPLVVSTQLVGSGIVLALSLASPSLLPSLRVMEKCGMIAAGEGSEPGTLRYSRRRIQEG
jgi:putative ABC transport system permease protein